MNKRKLILIKFLYIGLIIVIFMGIFFSNYGIIQRLNSRIQEESQLIIGIFLLLVYLGVSFRLLVKYNKTMGIKSRVQSFMDKLKKEDNDKIERPRIY